MAEKKKIHVKIQCQTCKRNNYWSRKGKKQVDKKLTPSKYCKWCKKHTTHKETKK
ncbi:MAG: 50S ribosomal protein L33 [Candidatus Portnoybacteria bacterium CG10_big_fil_rev_8_21_14_0_10_36_7]|uniref:Large ribosomal subunit protein bL33 n=1 Tax=Candidatus Portnoybacteria bacterium CG10_big_fil_rev_8_21_14_0_10_36_7 TaxID=1974812 RepID=A0A2M8KDQ1_9BACT|nr:MAG: 50S ribosomal protein L33 [Candidatus Portnoybacteria bacterium CG10_big_fil_rev_8_21_14_0_10_36_7]